MYKLLGLKLTPLRPFPCMSVGVKGDVNVTQLTNFFYKQSNLCQVCARFQSTNKNPDVVKQSKKRVRSRRKYTDLLAVTNSSVKQQKTSIKKLSWDEIELLATTNLKLSELYKLKDLSISNKYVQEHTYNNLIGFDNLISSEIDIFSNPGEETTKSVIISDIPSKSTNVDESLESLEIDPDILNVGPTFNTLPLQPAVVEEIPEECEPEAVEPQIFQTTTPLDRRARLEIANKTLGSYLEICSNLKNPQRGLTALIFHNSRASRGLKHFLPVDNIKIFNALLKGFAAKGDFSNIEEVVSLARKEKVALDVQSYVAIFECLGRVSVKDHYLRHIRIFVKEALHSGYTFDRIWNEGTFLNDEREMVLQTMRKFDPNYVPRYFEPKVQYDNHLVNHLNHDRQLEAPEEREFVENGGLFTPKSMKGAIKEQLELERRGYVTIKSIEGKGGVGEEVAKYREVLAQHFADWEETAMAAYKKNLMATASQRCALNDEPYLRCIPAKDFVSIIVEEAKKIAEGSETYSPTVKHLYRDLGNKVYLKFKVLRKQKTGVLDKVIKIHTKYCEGYAQQHGELGVLPGDVSVFNPRQQWQWAEHNLKGEGCTLSMDHLPWSPSVFQVIGKFLYTIIIYDLKVDVNSMRTNSKHKNWIPAFFTIFRHQGRLVNEEVKPHPVLSRLIRASMPETLTFPTCEVPMRCPPVPWTSIENGGYLISPCDVVRLPPQAVLQKERLAASDPVQLYPSLDSLNQLAAVPWRVNTGILDVILEVFKKGGSEKLDVPVAPSSLAPLPPITPDMDQGERYKMFRRRLQHKRKKAEMYSLWCDCLYRLSLANHFRDDIFWLPHNMDFRGRVYPVPPHLNHLGSDLARSMLVFAESRPLGPGGLDWLKLHLVNLTGLKKRDAVKDRIDFADEIMDKILDSADNPLTGQKWWAESDEPWQTLACCMEIARAVRSPNPVEYRSSFPVHQDGSCNGLQHYAALGRDPAGAYSVNLCPSDVPQDVYSAVVALVEEQRQKDAAAGLEVAKLLEGFVKRKVIKQTIMTTVYGVTRFGARLQIERQLKDLDNFPRESVWAASSYLTGRTFDSLRSMFTSTKEIQDWFTECARLITSVSGQHIEWMTPMGLPVVQPYFRFKRLGTNKFYKPFHMDQFERPNVMKHKNAFPPNFIHSLDSSHMMLTSLQTERAGITFVSVHDCYWTHPSTVDIMNKICREQFVVLHSEPILENLSLFLSEKFSYDNFPDDGSVAALTRKKLNRQLRQLPKRGEFDLSQVLRSVYFFS